MAAAAKQGCGIDGCQRPLYGRGLCHLHYQRWRKHGDPLASFKKVGRSICTVEGCERPIVGRGLCSRHYKIPERQCSVQGCERLVRTGGLCDGHAQRLRTHGDVRADTPLQARTKKGSQKCVVERCDRPNYYGDLCLAHYQRLRKHGDVQADVPLQVRDPGRLCQVEGCGRPQKGRGYCKAHLMRVRTHGHPQAGLPIFKKTATAWLKEHVDHAGDDCLTWPFARTLGGAGSVSGRAVGRKGNLSASRAMCILAHGEPPTPKHVAAHSCGKGHEACVNPRHLRWATMKENAADTLLHGTRPVLVGARSNRLTKLQVRAVRLLDGQLSPEEMARAFRVDLPAIQRALKVRLK